MGERLPELAKGAHAEDAEGRASCRGWEARAEDAEGVVEGPRRLRGGL